MIEYKNIINTLFISSEKLSSLLNLQDLTAKAIFALISITYVLGLLSFNILNLTYSINDVELIQSNYILAGFYFLAFYYVILILPNNKKYTVYKKFFFYIIIVMSIYILDEGHQNFFWYLVEKIFTDSSSFKHFTDSIQNKMIADFIIVMFWISVLYFVYNFGLKSLLSSSGKNGFGIIVLSIIMSLFIFSNFILIEIPKAIGGGKANVVRIEFTNDTEYKIKHLFDISVHEKNGYKYYGKLLYSDSDKVIMKPLPWYDDSIYEIPRNNIILISHKQYMNPLQLGYNY